LITFFSAKNQQKGYLIFCQSNSVCKTGR